MPVLDANLLVVLVSGDSRRQLVLQQFSQWFGKLTFHAPLLAKYEFANALTRMIAAGAFPEAKVEEAVNSVFALPVVYHPISNIARVVQIATMLRRQNAYDASHVALAESLQAELWTMDGSL